MLGPWPAFLVACPVSVTCPGPDAGHIARVDPLPEPDLVDQRTAVLHQLIGAVDLSFPELPRLLHDLPRAHCIDSAGAVFDRVRNRSRRSAGT